MQYRAGSEISIEVIPENLSKHKIEAIEMDSTPLPTELQVDVRDTTGKPVEETALNKSLKRGEALQIRNSLRGLGEPPPTLQPGKSRSNEIRLDRLFDLSHPGKYTVQVRRREKTGVVAKSNIMAITVVE